MTSNTEPSPTTGAMSAADMQEHIRTWKGFVRFIIWMSVGCAAILALLAIFRTP